MMDTSEQKREVVRRKYAEIARTRPSGGATGACCSSGKDTEHVASMIGDDYAAVAGYVADADLGLGCGVPVGHAGLEQGQTVLDLGCGAGLDVFVARREVGAGGRVIGVDMTAEMIARARQNASSAGFDNVEFRLGEIEHLPVDPESVDVVISNCVLNLVPDKARAFAEIYRVLKPGGHFCISDIVASGELPEWVQGIAEAYAGCVSGAITKNAYLDIVQNAGFADIEVLTEKRIEVPADLLARTLTPGQQAELAERDLHVTSVTVRATRPLD